MIQRVLCVGLLLFLVAACSRYSAAEMEGPAYAVADAATLQAPAGTFLAYETDVTVMLPGGAVAEKINAVQQACQQARFGDCAVLLAARQTGSSIEGRIDLRMAPAGVESILKLAGEGGEITQRSTHAEDLAQEVADTNLRRDRLQKEHGRLLAMQQRSSLQVSELLEISNRLAQIEAEEEIAQRDSAQQKRRIDTHKLTIRYNVSNSDSGRGVLGDSLARSGQVFFSSVAILVEVVAFVVPWLVVVIPGLGLIRFLWRRRRSKAQ